MGKLAHSIQKYAYNISELIKAHIEQRAKINIHIHLSLLILGAQSKSNMHINNVNELNIFEKISKLLNSINH